MSKSVRGRYRILVLVGVVLTLFVLALSMETKSPAAAWAIRSSRPTAMPTGRPAYWGFPSLLQAQIPGGQLRILIACGSTATAANRCIADNNYAGTGLDISSVREQGGKSTTVVTGFSPGAIGKILYRHGAKLFSDPATQRRYDGAIFYATQRVPGCADPRCGMNGRWIAYTNDGDTFVGHRRILADCSEYSPPVDSRCHDSSWWCDNGFPCDLAYPRSWWTHGEMVPLYEDGTFSALAYTYQYARPGYPLYSNPEIWTLASRDANDWTRGRRVRSDYVDPLYLQRDCISGPWMLNPDIARDESGTYYMTRSYSDKYAGCEVTFPDRVQVYSAKGPSELVAGPWTKLIDLGCQELGFQPDSAEILHDGLGTVVSTPAGTISLLVGVSGGEWTYSLCGKPTRQPGSCGPPPAHRVQEIVIAPARRLFGFLGN